MRLKAEVVAAVHRPSVVQGALVKFRGDRYWWTVQAVSEHFTALTRARPFHPDETLYTVIDWEQGVRGPCNLIGQGYDAIDAESCARMLVEFEAGRPESSNAYAQTFIDQGITSWPARAELQISYRNRVEIDIEKIKS